MLSFEGKGLCSSHCRYGSLLLTLSEGVFVVLSVGRGLCCSDLKVKDFVPSIAGRGLCCSHCREGPCYSHSKQVGGLFCLHCRKGSFSYIADRGLFISLIEGTSA